MKAYKPKMTNSSITLRYALMSLCLSCLCRSVIFNYLGDFISYDRRLMLTVLFNVVSVGMMSVISVFADKVNDKHTGVRLSVFLAVLGYILPPSFGINLKIVLLGIGSAAFYSFSSSSILTRSNGRARDIALLIGAQSIGIGLSGYTGYAGHFSASILIMLAVAADRYRTGSDKEPKSAENAQVSPFPAVFLFFSYLLLSYVFSSIYLPWNGSYKTRLLMLVFIGIGRAVGGFVCDRFGRIITVSVSACAGTALLFLFSGERNLALIGLLLLSMPLSPTLTAVTRVMPKIPAFSFALISCASYLGQILSHFVKLSQLSMLLIAAMVIAVTVTSELPFLPSKAEKGGDEIEDN